VIGMKTAKVADLVRRVPRRFLRFPGARSLVDVPLGRSGAKVPPPAPGEAPATDFVGYDVESGVATITLAMPENKNALSVELVNALGDHLVAAEADGAVRVVVLTNDGNTFCAGADLKGRSKAAPRHSLVSVLDAIVECPKPIVGRIAGHCTGGGVGLAAALDISVVADNALLGFTEVRLGVCPAVISVVCLPKLRRADASELFLSGERISAARARDVGLINYAVAPEELDAKVDEIVGKLVRGGPKALAASKQLVARVPQMSREAAFEWTAPLSQKLFHSDEAKEGITAFKERRDAAWVPESRRSGTGRA
jgi:methylglutaconyl-CoA hydratase